MNEGIYMGRVVHCSIRKGDKAYVLVAFRLNLSVFHCRIYLTANAKQFANKRLAALGVDGAQVSTLQEGAPGFESIVGQEFMFEYKREKEDKEPQWNVFVPFDPRCPLEELPRLEQMLS